MKKRIFAVLLTLGLVAVVGGALITLHIASHLPQMVSVEDYKPLLVSEVFDINGQKIGEYFRERRLVLPYDKIPQKLVKAFLAAEDASFFEHGGINYFSILRALIADLRAGKKVQGGSTITQQVAKSLLLTPEKTYIRKIREILLAYKMESHLTKEQILYLYLNQIYLGSSAHGVEAAAQVYFRKHAADLTTGEISILAGMPQAPSRYSPIINPQLAKQRQRYVLRRMAETGVISEEEAKKVAEEPLLVYVRENYEEYAPHFTETIRQYLVQKLGEDQVLDNGLKIYTTLDIKKQMKAQKDVQQGLREIDKRQGFRGAQKNLKSIEEITQFLLESKDKLEDEKTPLRILQADGTLAQSTTQAVNAEEIKKQSQKNLKGSKEVPKELKATLPSYVSINDIVDGVVTKVDDQWGLTTVRFGDSQGMIDIDNMKWARKPNPQVQFEQIGKPSQALKVGDVIRVKILGERMRADRINKKIADLKRAQKAKFTMPENVPVLDKYVELGLEQEPAVEGALLAFDLKTNDVVSMVGGYDYKRSKFNRAIQAARQTGSSFKPFVYAAGLDHGFTPATVIIDAPIVYQDEKLAKYNDTEGGAETKTWKPGNYGSKFGGDILFRNAIIQSKNIPTVKILEKVGVERAATYARRLGVFSPLNMDFTLGLGSSSVTLYEMTKAFASFPLLGKRMHPRMIVSVKDRGGHEVLKDMMLDDRFEQEIKRLDDEFETRRKAALEKRQTQQPTPAPEGKAPMVSIDDALFFQDPEQLMSPQTAYLMTTLLQGAIRDPGATAAKARVLGRPAGGKTGTTSSYYDAWFIGFTPQYATGVWVGFDDERSLGQGETGGDAALPIWIEYMKTIHEGIEERDFAVPSKIVFANIDNETGKLASASSKVVVRQAFLEGTEPGKASQEVTPQEEKDFFKEDLSQ